MFWTIVGVIGAIVMLVIGFLLGMVETEREISSAEDEAKRIINESIKAAEEEEALVEAREEIHKNRTYEREVKERRSELAERIFRGRKTSTATTPWRRRPRLSTRS